MFLQCQQGVYEKYLLVICFKTCTLMQDTLLTSITHYKFCVCHWQPFFWDTCKHLLYYAKKKSVMYTYGMDRLFTLRSFCYVEKYIYYLFGLILLHIHDNIIYLQIALEYCGIFYWTEMKLHVTLYIFFMSRRASKRHFNVVLFLAIYWTSEIFGCFWSF